MVSCVKGGFGRIVLGSGGTVAYYHMNSLVNTLVNSEGVAPGN